MRVDQKPKPEQTDMGCPRIPGDGYPGEQCGEVSVRVNPGEGKDVLRLNMERKREKSILEV